MFTDLDGASKRAPCEQGGTHLWEDTLRSMGDGLREL